jgi:type IV pilus assembly protein PilA
MKNKGFTLAELLAVIVILGLIAVITIPAVTKTLGEQKSKLCEDQLKNIKEAARLYGSDHLIELQEEDYSDGDENDSTKNGKTYLSITLKDLQDGGYIDKDIENPKTSEIIDSENIKILIKKSGKKYNYEVTDFCSNDS